jgi:hypothetical protein
VIGTIIAVVLVFFVNLLFASLMNSVAVSKGHEDSYAFVLVLFFGVLGMLYVIALPDKTAREQMEDILAVLLDRDQGGEN